MVCFRWRCTRRLALLHSVPVASIAGQVRYITRPKSRTMRVIRQLMLPPSTIAFIGSNPSVECIYTTVDVAAVQLIRFIHAHVGPTAGHLPAPSSLRPERTRIASFSLMPVGNWQTEGRMMKSEWCKCGRVGLCQVGTGHKGRGRSYEVTFLLAWPRQSPE